MLNVASTPSLDTQLTLQGIEAPHRSLVGSTMQDGSPQQHQHVCLLLSPWPTSSFLLDSTSSQQWYCRLGGQMHRGRMSSSAPERGRVLLARLCAAFQAGGDISLMFTCCTPGQAYHGSQVQR